MKSHFALPAPTHKIAQEIEDAATTIRKEIPASAVPGAVLAKQLDERVVEALSSSLKHPDVLERAFLFVQVNNQEDAVVERIGVALAGELMKSEDTHARGIGVRWMERLARLEIYEARLHLAQEKLMAGRSDGGGRGLPLQNESGLYEAQSSDTVDDQRTAP